VHYNTKTVTGNQLPLVAYHHLQMGRVDRDLFCHLCMAHHRLGKNLQLDPAVVVLVELVP